MSKEFSFSILLSENYSQNKRHEESLLSECKRFNMQQESFYFQTDPIVYSPLPSFIPKSLLKSNTHCIYLENYSFYEMLTFAIFQHLLKRPTQKKMLQIKKLKNLICTDSFLDFASYTKGLLLKGITLMIKNSQNQQLGSPVAQVLMGSEKILAFCQCWKEMISYFNQNRSEVEEDINSSMIEIFTKFFELEIHFYTKKGKDFQPQIIKSKKKSQINGVITIVLISSSYDEQEESPRKQQSFSQISSIYGNWSYYILLNYPEMEKIKEQKPQDLVKKSQNINRLKNRKRETLAMDYPELFAIDEQKFQPAQSHFQMVNFSDLITRSKQVVKKGYSLLSNMSKFTQSIEKI